MKLAKYVIRKRSVLDKLAQAARCQLSLGNSGHRRRRIRAQKPHWQLIPKMLAIFRGQKVIGSLVEVTAQVGELGATHGKGWSSMEPAEVGLSLPITLVNFRWYFLHTWLPGLMLCCHRAAQGSRLGEPPTTSAGLFSSSLYDRGNCKIPQWAKDTWGRGSSVETGF